MRSPMLAGGGVVRQRGHKAGSTVRPAVGYSTLVRTLAAAGGLAWLLLTGAPEPALLPLLWCFVIFSVASLVLYAVSLRRPGLVRIVRPAELALDTALVFCLVRATGGVRSDFLVGFYLIAAIHSVRFGWRPGLALAGLAAVLCVAADPAALREQPWIITAVRLAFLPVIAAASGALSGRADAQHRRADELDEQLREETERLREAVEQTERMRHELLQANRLADCGKIAAQLAHHIKNPLGSIALNVEMLQDELRAHTDVDTTEAEELLRSVQAEVDLLTELTESYLNFARLPTLEPRPVNVNEVLVELTDFLEAEMNRDRVTITRNLSPDLPAIPLDRKQFKLAFANLIRNSLEALEGGGRLRVATARNGQSVRIELSDTGRGIAKGEENKIFEMFYSTKLQGSGLGLTMTRRIVEEHGGSISCRSVAGTGTTFTIHMPLNGRAGGGHHVHEGTSDGSDR